MSRRRQPSERIRDQRVIAQMYLEGYTQEQIAERLGIHQSTVSRQLKELHAQWLEEANKDYKEARDLELRKLAKVETEAWAAWRRSLGTKKTTVVEQVRGGKEGHLGRREVIEEELTGNPAFLRVVLQAIKQRAKILGLEAAQDITGGIKVIIQHAVDDDYTPPALPSPRRDRDE